MAEHPLQAVHSESTQDTVVVKEAVVGFTDVDVDNVELAGEKPTALVTVVSTGATLDVELDCVIRVVTLIVVESVTVSGVLKPVVPAVVFDGNPVDIPGIVPVVVS